MNLTNSYPSFDFPIIRCMLKMPCGVIYTPFILIKNDKEIFMRNYVLFLLLILSALATPVVAGDDDRRFPLKFDYFATQYTIYPGEVGTYTITITPYRDEDIVPDVKEGVPQLQVRTKHLDILQESFSVTPSNAATCTLDATDLVSYVVCDRLNVLPGMQVVIQFNYLITARDDGEVITKINLSKKRKPLREYRLKDEHSTTIHYKEPDLKLEAKFLSDHEGDKPIGTYSVSISNRSPIPLTPENFLLRVKADDFEFVPKTLEVIPPESTSLCSIDLDQLRCSGVPLPGYGTVQFLVKGEMEKKKKTGQYKFKGTLEGKLKIRGFEQPLKFKEKWESQLWRG